MTSDIHPSSSPAIPSHAVSHLPEMANKFSVQHIEKKQWKAWQVVLMVLTFPLSAPLFLVAQAISRGLTDKLLLDARSKNKNMMSEKRTTFEQAILAGLSTIKKVKSQLVDTEYEILAYEKATLASVNETYKDRPKFLEGVGANYKQSLIKTISESLAQPNEKSSLNIKEKRLLLAKVKKTPPAKIWSEMQSYLNEQNTKQEAVILCLRALKEAIELQLKISLDPNVKTKMDTLYKEKTILTADGIDLNGYEIRNQAQQEKQTPPKDQKWMICLVGKDDFYENRLGEFEHMSQKTGTNILTINYRGVGASQDSVSWDNHLIGDDIVEDGLAAVNELLKQGVLPENIVMYGHSQGGAVAAKVTALIPGMHLCSDRSFSCYADAIKGVIGGLIGKIVALISPSWWKFNSMEAIETIASKEHKGQQILIIHENDGVVVPDASVVGGLQKIAKSLDQMVPQIFEKIGSTVRAIVIKPDDITTKKSFLPLSFPGMRQLTQAGMAAHSTSVIQPGSLEETETEKKLYDHVKDILKISNNSKETSKEIK